MSEKIEYETKPLGQDDGDEGATSSDNNLDESELEDTGTNEERSDESDVESDDDDDNSASGVDYEAELQRERDRLGRKIDREREKRLNAERNQGMTPEQVAEIVRKEVSKTEKRIFVNQATQIATTLSRSDAEKDLILHHYNHSIIPSGNLEEDMKNAWALANRKKLNSTISELQAAARSKNTRASSSSAGSPLQTKKPARYSQDDIDGARFANVSVEEFVKHKNSLKK